MDYHIQTARNTGGKAGKGCNKTSTIQVYEVIGDMGFLKKHFRFAINDPKGYAKAQEKARAWVAAQQTLAPDAVPVGDTAQ